MNRELDLGRLMQKVGRRMVEEGQATSQRFHDWKRVEAIQVGKGNCMACGGEGYVYDEQREAVQCEACKGTGDCTEPGRGTNDGQLQRQASRLAGEWTTVRVQLEHFAKRASYLMDQAKAAENRLLDKHRTPAQVEADGWCGSHWRIGELVPVALRSTGEPYYRGRCRPCGGWPDGDPPLDVLRTWRDGKTLRVKAS